MILTGGDPDGSRSMGMGLPAADALRRAIASGDHVLAEQLRTVIRERFADYAWIAHERETCAIEERRTPRR